METRQQRRYREREEASAARRRTRGIKVQDAWSAGYELSTAIQSEIDDFGLRRNDECVRMMRANVASLVSNDLVTSTIGAPPEPEPAHMHVEMPREEGERTRIYIHERFVV
jgi:hypothetical protein